MLTYLRCHGYLQFIQNIYNKMKSDKNYNTRYMRTDVT
jgi:hypothetical protein